MKNLIILTIIMFLPIYLIAQEQLEKHEVNNSQIITSEHPTLSSVNPVKKPQKPTAAPSILSDKDKAAINKIKEFKNNIPLSIQNELKAFKEKKEQLSLEKKKLYDMLSAEAKKVIASEGKLRRTLSIQARKAAKESLLHD